jgi:hypothetical protein
VPTIQGSCALQCGGERLAHPRARWRIFETKRRPPIGQICLCIEDDLLAEPDGASEMVSTETASIGMISGSLSVR